jgi:hypothetical protein
LVETGAGDAGVEFLGEGFGLAREGLAFRRIEPSLQVRLGVEAQRPTSIGAMPSMRLSRSCDCSQATAPWGSAGLRQIVNVYGQFHY